jgi:predicted peptidase
VYDAILVGSLVSAVLLSIALGDRWSLSRECTTSESIRQKPVAAAPFPPCPAVPSGASPGRFTTEQFIGQDGTRLTYYLYLPPHFQPTLAYPIVLLLHGAGESAVAGAPPEQNRDTVINQRYVQAWVAPSAQAEYPCILVVPQVVGGNRWANDSGRSESPAMTPLLQPTSALRTAMEIVVTLDAQFSSLDGHRLYIVGVSMGAQGVWAAIEQWPSLFAGAAPLSGAGDSAQADAVARLPLWDFQGAQDATQLVAGARTMYADIHAAGGAACYTEFPNQGHDLWNTVQVYQNPTFRQWLFSQTRAPSPLERPLSCTGLSIDGVQAR